MADGFDIGSYPADSTRQAMFISEGRKKAKIIGVILTVLFGINAARDLVCIFIPAPSYLINLTVHTLLTICAVKFIGGSNKARLLLGVLYFAALILSAPALLSSLLVFAAMIVITIPVLAVYIILIYFTLFDESVKAYCKQSKENL
ncbi:MAG: hypothetical protein NC120_08545 [Ruminococcus sp.]|nr:hypothetical protein [Ruminococcus sp.]